MKKKLLFLIIAMIAIIVVIIVFGMKGQAVNIVDQFYEEGNSTDDMCRRQEYEIGSKYIYGYGTY